MNDVVCSAKAEKIMAEIEWCKSYFSVCPSDHDGDAVPCPYFVEGFCDKCMTGK